MFRANNLSVGVNLTGDPEYEADYEAIYAAIKASKFKKTEFALSVISSDADWVTPEYIADGLKWLEVELRATIDTDAKEPVA